MTPTVLHIFSGDLWAGAEVLVYGLLRELSLSQRCRILALSLNEGVLTEKIRRIGINPFVIPESRHSFPSIVWKALQLLRGTQIHVIHSHRCKENLLAATLASLLSSPLLVTTVHGIEGLMDELPPRQRFLAWLDRNTLKHRFARVVAVSQEIAEHLATVLGFPSERICVIHNGIVLPHTAPATAPEHSLRSHEPAPHIGNVGRFVPVKDHALFLEVAARLRQLIPAARFSILGDGPLREALELRSTELGLDDHIRFIPPCNDPSSYYRSLDLYLNTSQHEGIPLSILEAMAHGIPVVAPRVGGLPEILSNGQGGNLIPERLPDAFARRCVAILTDPAVYQTCAREAVTIVRERFTIGQTAMAYASLYESLLQSRSGQRPFPV